MNFTKEKIDFYLMDTQIENMFINEYMPLADGNYVKVYVFARMYADQSDAMSNETIAKHLNLEVEDVLKAWNYWERQGVIKKHIKSESNQFDYVVEFISLKQLFSAGNNKPSSPTDQQKKKKYSAKDVEVAMRNNDVKQMFNEIQSISGRPFEGNEMFEILEWLDAYKMKPDLVAQAYSYCINKKNKNSFKYIASIVRSWHDSQIQTLEDLEQHVEKTDIQNSKYKRILKALGLNFRYPTEEERRIMDTWFDEWNFDLDAILEACKKTSGISNPNINYINSVLKNWKEKGPNAPADPSSRTSSKTKTKIKNTKMIFNEYEIIRNNNEKLHESRRYKIYEEIPRIKAIDEEISKSSVAISKVVLMQTGDPKEKVKQLRKQINSLSQEKAFLLTENNYSADFLNMIYECETCKDTGLLANGEKCPCFLAKLKEDKSNE